ncbi:hypothetical protein ElP_73700 (plasmid) [Tautonia plasticadhaerens]|uniref:Uncharacterized protein n=2 Tax=Tautonia plasticadhaerens TaxID=2527974 RepID=A0A518HEY3_9BACT|nr:hypothetical protein ElP_73700 [Tautonia plasticadhaerens]
MTTEVDGDARSTRRRRLGWALLLVLGSCGDAIGGEGGRDGPRRPHLLQRLRPAGGWHPDDGGLLHWWDPHCFPRGGAPDDYRRKPPPQVCWPPYPPYYIWVPPGQGTPHPAGGIAR